jgi:hypothetical protein
MDERERHSGLLFTAELQFRLASAVRLATTLQVQPLDLPQEWTHGKQRVSYEEIALRPDQADFAACFLQRSATFLMAVAMKDAIRAVVHDPKRVDDPVRSAYQIARLIRNAFAHAPFSPTWSIDDDCRDVVFEVPDVIVLNTHGLHGTLFDWRHYGGPLALFRLCRFVRAEILKDVTTRSTDPPIPQSVIHQVGSLVLRRDEIPAGAVRIDSETLPDGGIALPGGYVVRPVKKPHDSDAATDKLDG